MKTHIITSGYATGSETGQGKSSRESVGEAWWILQHCWSKAAWPWKICVSSTMPISTVPSGQEASAGTTAETQQEGVLFIWKHTHKYIYIYMSISIWWGINTQVSKPEMFNLLFEVRAAFQLTKLHSQEPEKGRIFLPLGSDTQRSLVHIFLYSSSFH